MHVEWFCRITDGPDITIERRTTDTTTGITFPKELIEVYLHNPLDHTIRVENGWCTDVLPIEDTDECKYRIYCDALYIPDFEKLSITLTNDSFYAILGGLQRIEELLREIAA